MRRQKKRKQNPQAVPARRSPIIKVLVIAAMVSIAAITVVSRQLANKQVNAVPVTATADASGNKYVIRKVGGQVVKVNSQTGQIKPLTQDEARQMAEGLKKMLNTSTDGLAQVQHADGTIQMDLQGRFQNVAVARMNEDGSVTQSCIDDPRAAASFFGIDPKLLGVEGAKTSAPTSTTSAKSQLK
jgi:hypothetical protein